MARVFSPSDFQINRLNVYYTEIMSTEIWDNSNMKSLNFTIIFLRYDEMPKRGLILSEEAKAEQEHNTSNYGCTYVSNELQQSWRCPV